MLAVPSLHSIRAGSAVPVLLASLPLAGKNPTSSIHRRKRYGDIHKKPPPVPCPARGLFRFTAFGCQLSAVRPTTAFWASLCAPGGHPGARGLVCRFNKAGTRADGVIAHKHYWVWLAFCFPQFPTTTREPMTFS